jgi:DNA-binding Lrp family transcriptional regulator
MLNEMRLSRQRAKLPASTAQGGKRMAGSLQVDLDQDERRVLKLLVDAGRPLEVVELASAARLSVEETKKIVKGLVDKGVAGRVDPEPIRNRVEVDNRALALVAS